MSLAPDDLARLDKALTAVIQSPGFFTDFEVDFAFSNADRLEAYGAGAFWSEKQWEVIDGIEKKLEESDE